MIARRPLYGMALWLGLALATVHGAPTAAEETVTLDPERRAALADLPALRGTPVDTADLDGKVVVLAFFASWCPPCDPEFDYLNQIDQAYRDQGVTIVTVNIFENYFNDNNPARLQSFLDRKAPHFAVLGDGEHIGPLFNDVQRIPTLFVFGRDGGNVMQFVHEQGATKTHASYDEIERAVRAAL